MGFDGKQQTLQFEDVDVLSAWVQYYVRDWTNGYVTLFGKDDRDKSLRGSSMYRSGDQNDWMMQDLGEWSQDENFFQRSDIRLYSSLGQWHYYTGNRQNSFAYTMNEIGVGSYSGSERGLNGYMFELIVYSTVGSLTDQHGNLLAAAETISGSPST